MPHLAATPQTVHIGQFDATFPLVLTVRPVETVMVGCVSGRQDALSPSNSGFIATEALSAILAASPHQRRVIS